MRWKGQPGVGFSSIPRASSGFYIYMKDDDLYVRSRPSQPYKTDFCSEFYRAQMQASASGIAFTIPQELESAINWSRDSNDTWKDTITRAQFGTLFMIVNPDGSRYHPADHSCPSQLLPDEGDVPWTIVKEWSQAVDGNTAAIDYVFAADEREFLVLADNVTCSISTARQVILSTDAGASYFGGLGQYRWFGTNGVQADQNGIWLAPINSTAALSGQSWITNVNAGNRRVLGTSVTHANGAYLFIGSNDPVNALRVRCPSGVFNGGRVTVFAR